MTSIFQSESPKGEKSKRKFSFTRKKSFDSSECNMATTKKKQIKMTRQKKKLFRSNEPLISVMVWSVNNSIRELENVNIPVMLMPADFKAYTKVKVDNYLYNKENLPSKYKLKNYCPLVFRNLRERFNVDDEDYLSSMTACDPISSGLSPGKTNAKFFMAHDRNFIVKTMASEDVEQMHHVLKDYHQFILECSGVTLLPQYLNMFRLTVDGTETYMMIMRNIFSTSLHIHRKYDLKGSTFDRKASDKEKAKAFPTLKDNDFRENQECIHIGSEAKEALIKRLERDVQFLQNLKIMDYSLLIGIHDCALAAAGDCGEDSVDLNFDEELENSGGEDDDQVLSSSGEGPPTTPPQHTHNNTHHTPPVDVDPKFDVYALKSAEDAPNKCIYFIGLIDCLTHWGTKKKMAQAAKTVRHGSEADNLSTVNPEQYARRFMDLVNEICQ